MHHQMQVMAAGHRVEGERPRVVEEHVVGADSRHARDPRLVVVAAQHINVPRHVAKVPGVRDT